MNPIESNNGSSIRLFHICHGRPIGPSWCAYMEKPELPYDPYDQYGTWIEETTLAELVVRFQQHIEYARENNFPEGYYPYALTIGVRYK